MKFKFKYLVACFVNETEIKVCQNKGLSNAMISFIKNFVFFRQIFLKIK